jgi:hypothetical protein
MAIVLILIIIIIIIERYVNRSDTKAIDENELKDRDSGGFFNKDLMFKR